MVDIFVGAEKKKYHLHRDLLCERSEFFKASFMGSFKEAEAGELELPEDDVVSFELLVKWLYGGSLIKIDSKDELPAYFDLVMLARKLCLEHLQNEAMDHILRFYRTSLPTVEVATIRRIYENTLAGDPLRRLSIRCASWMAMYNEIDISECEYRDLLEEGGDIAVDFASTLVDYCYHTKGQHYRMEDVDPRRLPNCSYHKHKSTPICGRQINEGVS